MTPPQGGGRCFDGVALPEQVAVQVAAQPSEKGWTKVPGA
jgi:hypothetical protein